MKGLAPVLAAVAVLTTAAPASALRSSEMHELGPSYGAPYEALRTALTSLSGGGYVAAWERFDDAEALGTGARIFDADSEVAGEVACLAPPLSAQGYRASLAPVGDGFVLACEDVHDTPPWFTSHLQAFTASGEPAGPALAFDDVLMSQVPRLTAHDDDSWAVSYERCDDRACLDAKLVQDVSGTKLAEFTVPRLEQSRLVRIDGGFLAIGTGRVSERARVSILARLLDENGATLGPPLRLARLRLDQNIEVFPDASGRTAVSWAKTDRTGVRTTYVRTFDAFGAASPANVTVAFPPSSERATSVPFALPLVEGFLLLYWESRELWNDPVLSYSYASFVREYDGQGAPRGDELRLPGTGIVIPTATQRTLDDSWLVLGISHHAPDGADTLTIDRISQENRCGDTTGDERVDTLDAQNFLRTISGLESCEPCRCDVDGDGLINLADLELVLEIALGREWSSCPVCAGD